MGETYQSTLNFSTTDVVKPIPKKFIQRAREKRAKGEPYQHWVRAARIINHIELDMMPRYRRKTRRRGRRAAV